MTSDNIQICGSMTVITVKSLSREQLREKLKRDYSKIYLLQYCLCRTDESSKRDNGVFFVSTGLCVAQVTGRGRSQYSLKK